uniref:Uncharacterized protein n=1 Tax=Picea glauca TaxID=3330 RepID=A0A101LUY3_PICGL|nr:hypothetical protein ABT39_MTgene2347 [Picea glauca]QHR92279.1 hypothetical protein Q903MT_gene6320 [Picea sitchensis]
MMGSFYHKMGQFSVEKPILLEYGSAYKLALYICSNTPMGSSTSRKRCIHK